MNKMIYWVSVGKHEIVPKGEGANYEFEIEASDDELDQLRELFDEADHVDNSLLSRAATPYEAFEEVDQDAKNLPYDMQLKEIYRIIYNLGLPETKAHIMRMGII
jgi:hypothetical protein